MVQPESDATPTPTIQRQIDLNLSVVPEADESRCPHGVLDIVRDAFKSRTFPIYLYGNVGAGKTFTSAVVFRKFIAKNPHYPLPRWESWIRFSGIAAKIDVTGSASTYDYDGEYVEHNDRGWWEIRTAQPSLFVMDEIGTREASDARFEIMLRFLEIREGKPTILTGNLDDRGIIDAYDDRVRSRLRKGTWIRFDGPDLRQDGKSERNFKIK